MKLVRRFERTELFPIVFPLWCLCGILGGMIQAVTTSNLGLWIVLAIGLPVLLITWGIDIANGYTHSDDDW